MSFNFRFVEDLSSSEARIIERLTCLSTTYFQLSSREVFKNKRLVLIRKNPWPRKRSGVLDKSLTMTYSHMGKPHTTIGDAAFHFWVRKGFRWFHSSMVVKQTGLVFLLSYALTDVGGNVHQIGLDTWVLIFDSLANRRLLVRIFHTVFFSALLVTPNKFGCYMVKPHGQLVSVSSTPHNAYTPDLSTWWSSRALQGT